jgi:maleate cis-trans isomerase
VNIDISSLISKYVAHVGFVTTPKYFDDAIQEFLKVAPKGVGAIQRVLSLDGYSWELTERAEGMPELERSAQALAESHCDVVVQVGTNWVHAAGTTPEGIGGSIDRISSDIGVPFLMAGQCIVDALHHIGAKRIGVANSYYRDDWRDGINRYLTQAGFEIAASGSIIDQGIVSSLEEALAIEAATLWNYPASVVRQAIVETYRVAPDVDAVVQTGAGFRTIDLLPEIEEEIGIPVIPSDGSSFWAALKALDLPAVPGFGSLLDSRNG